MAEAEAVDEHEAFMRRLTPHTLGSDHFWGDWPFDNPPEFKGDIAWAHRCTNHGNSPEPVLVVARIDVSSGERHRLLSRDPLTIGGSIFCPDCKDHGFITEGVWQAA